MKKLSRQIISDQTQIHKDLLKITQKYQLSEYLRPIAPHSEQTFEEIISFIGDREVILDTCCGVGESTYHLARRYPDKFVVGIDKSFDRISRKNDFKNSNLSNMKIFRGELLDLWFLFFKNKSNLNISKQFILYPNPYPKIGHIKKRWHGNPVSKFIFGLCDEIEIRSNWKLYLDEFLFVGEQYAFNGSVTKMESFEPITPFERKYSLSNQSIYQLKLKRPSV